MGRVLSGLIALPRFPGGARHLSWTRALEDVVLARGLAAVDSVDGPEPGDAGPW